ncbi:MAG: tetratricopeptide repeat protein [Planctomycetota bacterium]|nr:MAG: tetratricopeptide repeat protein [Planctomycetota bacterium]
MDDVSTLIREGRLTEAEAQLNQRQSEAISSAEWHYHRGLLLEAKGQVEDAVEAYESALRIDENHTEALFRMAYNLDLHGNEDRAIELYESLATRSPTHVSALLNLVTIYEDQNNYQKAYECVERVLTENPNHPRARLFRKDILSSMNMLYDEVQERDREKRDAILDTSVADFELSVRSRNCLKKMNINSLGDLLRISEAELLAYKNFGETSLNEIKIMLKQRNLRLGQLKEEAKPQLSHQLIPLDPLVPEGSPEVLNKPLSEIELSGRSRKCLQRLNLVTLGDLVIKTESELLATKNFGQTSLSEIKQKLTDLGLSLRKAD